MRIEKPRFPIREILLFGFWPSPLKKLMYRMRGYRIGRGVSLAMGCVVVGEDVEIGDHAAISFFTVIRGKRIRLGAHVKIGAASFFDTPHLELGEGTKINEQVFVGGLQFPDSQLIVGRNCQIMQMTFINPTRTIRIGDDSGIGGDCLLFGHSSWLSKFEGYPVEFDSIEIGNSVSLAWRVFVLPGTRIGDGAVIGANSLVRGEVPPRCLAAGFPARVVAKPPEFPRDLSSAEQSQILRDVVTEMAGYFRASGFPCTETGPLLEVEEQKGRLPGRARRRWRLLVAHGPQQDAGNAADADVLLSLCHIPDSDRAQWRRRGKMWIDLSKKERSDRGNDLGEEVCLYLRRYGVRLNRVREQT
jgi:acetyltransferase-like isoleucine patch superfamily enzyme